MIRVCRFVDPKSKFSRSDESYEILVLGAKITPELVFIRDNVTNRTHIRGKDL